MGSDDVAGLLRTTPNKIVVARDRIAKLIRRVPAVSLGGLLIVPALLVGEPSVDFAETADEIQFVLNTFSFLVWGALVMWMCAGFTMLESGSVRTKNASMICMKNIGIYSIAGLAFYFIGYNLMYVEVGDFIGSVKLLYGPSSQDLAIIEGDAGADVNLADPGYSTMSDWFFQMVFVATAASDRFRRAC